MARKRAQTQSGAPVKISVAISADTHARLRCLVTMRRTTTSEFVNGLVEGAVAKVRLPTIGGADDAANENAA